MGGGGGCLHVIVCSTVCCDSMGQVVLWPGLAPLCPVQCFWPCYLQSLYIATLMSD